MKEKYIFTIALIFAATAYDNTDDYLVKFKKTVETIVFK
jgi:hypothetical protein